MPVLYGKRKNNWANSCVLSIWPAIRESSLNDIYISTAETLRLKQVTNVVGVKGRSAFAILVDGLPLTAPVDYMHCILQGVFPDVLRICDQSLTTQEKDSGLRIMMSTGNDFFFATSQVFG